MELLVVVLVPLMFLSVAASMMVVSQVSGFLTFMRYSGRQRLSNRVISEFLGRMASAQTQLARRSRELARLSASLAASNRDLERLNDMKTRFMSVAAHDVRNPIATIRGYAEILADRPLPERDLMSARGILSASRTVNRLISDLTDMAVIEAGKLRMEPALFDAAGLVSETASGFALLANNKGVSLSVESPPPGTRLVADRFRVGQVLSNLLANALKFTPSGGRVELRAVPSASGALFVVADTGPGIHPAERRRIFEQFYQSRHSDPVFARKGWGLGLSIAQEIVRLHQGAIGVESAGLGKGSRFWFFIPAAPDPRGAAPRPPRRLLAAAGIAALILLLAGAGPRRAAAQGGGLPAQSPGAFPLEEKARFDRFLEEKAESVLLKMLGPNRARVVVDSSLDFTRTERFEIMGGAKKGEGPSVSALYAWQNMTTQGGSTELLPGIPLNQAMPGAGLPPYSYERQHAMPASFIKKLVVTIILDKSVDRRQADAVQRIVANILEIDPERGDVLDLVTTEFAPAWKTVWHSQDSFSMVFKYAVVSLMTLITLVVVAACFLKLAGAMDAMARSQTQQYAMELGMRDAEGGRLALPGEAESAGRGEGGAARGEMAAGPGGAREAVPAAPGEVRIEVRAEQVPVLIEILKDEDPENVAIVAGALEAGVRREFLAGLPTGTQAELLVRLAKPRYVESDLMERVKSEVERRIAGMVGGMSRVLEAVETAAPDVQRRMLDELRRRDPELARSVRSKVFLLEDLATLQADEWGHLMARTRIEQWAAALRDSPDVVRDALRGQILPNTWIVVEQLMTAPGMSPARALQAQTGILGEVDRLRREGKIRSAGGGPASASAAPDAAPAGIPTGGPWEGMVGGPEPAAPAAGEEGGAPPQA